MNTKELFKGITYTGNLPDVEVCAVTQDSRKVRNGHLFVCTKGITSDGHDFAAAALKAGAAAVVCERSLGLSNEIIVPNTRMAYALLCQNFFGRPADKLKLIAVTGTNGKTTVTSLLKQILEQAGHKCGLIGTIHVEIDNMEVPAKYTTPEPWDLNALFARMVMAGCEYAVMEASSQALHQLRLYGLHVACAAFTNLTQDHLDYHGTLEAYFKAKEMLFAQCDKMVLNLDDPYTQRIMQDYPDVPVLTFSAGNDEADYTARDIKLSAGGTKFAMVGKGIIERVQFPMPGDYSVHNALTAAVCAIACGIKPQVAAAALSKCHGVCGRSEVLYHGDFTVIVDYAHTGDGIEKMLSSVAPFVEGRLVVLFGCAGERDAKKRPAMAHAALKYGDYIVLTSDNPRKENPEAILSDVEPILKAGGKPYHAEVERRTAVLFALEQLKKDDVLVLCGKGHEDYQVIDGVTIYLDEHRIVRDWIAQKGL
ncbi:MAG: UDP-N-acetylmuramoyl-L-alanyl-D-glutamate--2,6-diaminopimelate ligase [Oscillospiraceae bacterium]|nr:UDP-N-acetylmuramoyl-L-alanyl-D-glutamate--2,6-diaminopimelate ligase [Oscillospiraceae bacterium]